MKPLEGVKIVDFTQAHAGSLCTMLLAGFGAEVIKIERPGRGEDGRKFPPMVDGESLTYCWFNRGKKSLAVDMKDPEGLELVKKLIPTAQVILENFRPGTMKKFGLDYESVCKVKPDMVYVSLTTYGQTGRLISKPGYDIIAQAMSGIMSVTGEADGAPQKSGIPLGDMVGALNMFASTMTALYHWKDTGEGQYVDVSLLRSLLYMNTPLIHCNLGKERMSKRQGNHHPTMCPYGVFHCKDGDIVMAASGKRIWDSLCDLMGRPEWKEDPEYQEVGDRARHQKVLIPLFNEWLTNSFSGQDEALAALDAAGIPCCKVQDEYQAWSNEDFRENGVQFLTQELGRCLQNVCDAGGVLGGQGRDGAHGVNAVGRHGLHIRLDTGASAGIASGNGQCCFHVNTSFLFTARFIKRYKVVPPMYRLNTGQGPERSEFTC